MPTLKTLLIPLLALVTLTLSSPHYAPGPILTPHLTPRQNTPTTAQTPLLSCLDYSRIANLSTVGSNSSYRSPFYHLSKTGSMYDNQMFSAAIAALPPLMMDVQLNARCGNLSQVAIVEAARNLTNGTVLQFDGVPVMGIKAGVEVVVIVSAIVVLFFGVWGFMP